MSWEGTTMQSRTSFFNGTLFRKSVTRFWPIWGAYLLIWFLVLPMTILRGVSDDCNLDDWLQGLWEKEARLDDRAVKAAKAFKGKPSVIIAKSVKGKGVSYMENNVSWHGAAPNEEQYNIAMAELKA